MISPPEDFKGGFGYKDVFKDQVLTDPEVKRLAHLPLLTFLYLTLQRQASATPVLPLEVAAYLGIEVETAEEILAFLAKKGLVTAFKQDFPAYYLSKEIEEISLKDLMELLFEFDRVLKKQGLKAPLQSMHESNEKYRRLYSELASDILQLFGKASANQLPV